MIAALTVVAMLAGSPALAAPACPCASTGGAGGSCTQIDTAELETLFSTDPGTFVERIQRYASVMSDCERDASAQFNYYAGLSHMIRNQHLEAEQALQRTLALQPSLALQYRALASLANVNFLEGDYVNAFTHGIELSDLKYAGIDVDGRARGKIVIANALIEAGLYQQAEEALDGLNTSELAPRLACVAHYVRIQLLYKRGDTGVPTEPLLQDIAWCRENDQVLYALLATQGLSRILTNAGELEASRQTLQEHLAEVRAFGYNNLLALWLSAQSQNALLQGDVEQSIALGQEALDVETASLLLEVALPAHRVLARAHEMAGNLDKALAHSKAYHQAYASAHDRQLASATAYQAVLMREAQRNQDVELLRLENRLARAEAENARLYLVIAGVVLLMMSLLAHRAIRSQRKLRQRMRYDTLTGVMSRDHFQQELAKALGAAEKRGEDLGLILFDLDRFKRINDEHGHPTGDWALQEVATAARKVLASPDAIGRLGGEEFAVLLRSAAPDRTRQVAERIRRAFEAIETTATDCDFTITASLGCTTASRSGYSVETLIGDADKALYRSKQGGRNRVSFSAPAVDRAAMG